MISGTIDPVMNSITIKVALSKLNQFIPTGHTPIGIGSVLVGLRGQTFTIAILTRMRPN